MNPLEIKRLAWDEFCVNRAVSAAYSDLIALADRPVILHDLALVPGVSNSFRTGWYGGIHIFIDLNSVRRDHSLVHELLHEILIAEQYSHLAGIPARFSHLRSILSNEFDHPEIFRRMEKVYRLNMDKYWEHWHREMRRELVTLKNQARDKDYWIEHFPRLYTWFFQEVSTPYLADYAAHCPRVFQAVEAAFTETKEIGFATALNQRRTIGLFREHWLRFCERQLPRNPYGSTPEALVEATEVKPLIERDKTVTADNLMCLLHWYGFVPS